MTEASKAELQRLTQMCENFLAAKIPVSNIIPIDQFSRFIPLFNKDAIKALTQEQLSALSQEYMSTFSLQHPIKIVSTDIATPDEKTECVYFEEAHAYRRVLHTLPPMFKPLHTLNELGAKVPALINSFANTATTDNPLDHRNEMYGQAIAEALRRVNPETEKKKCVEEFNKAEETLLRQRELGNTEPTEAVGNNSQNDDTPIKGVEIEW